MSVKDNTYGIAPLQDKMLDILKYFISLCEKYNLRYCAYGGTCIGAFRHQGFIPWDDDLDVSMPRPDYEKLWNLCGQEKQNNKKYKLCRTTENKNYHHRVMQMVDLETTFINRRSMNEDIEHGVYIDIIPLDACPSSSIRRLSQIINSVLFSVYNIQNPPEFNGGRIEKAAVNILLKLIRDPKKRAKIWQRAEKKMICEKWGTTEKIVELTTSFKTLFHPYPKEWLLISGKKMRFEDICIVVPDMAEDYLTAGFGNFMHLPPQEDRHPRHNTVMIDLDNSYKKYKGKYYLVIDSEK